MNKSINQIAQEDGDTAANEVARLKANEMAVVQAWRHVAYHNGVSACSIASICERSGLPMQFVVFVCTTRGMALS